MLDDDTLNVDVTQVGNSNVTSSSGVLEVNTTQINGDASAAAALDAAIDNSNNVVAVNVKRIDNSTPVQATCQTTPTARATSLLTR